MNHEVKSDTAGRCPKCGMKLVPADGLGKLTWKSYLPLIVLGIITAVVLGIGTYLFSKIEA